VALKFFFGNLAARAWRNIRAEAGANLGTVLAVGLAVSIPLIFSLLAINMGRLVDSFVGQVEMVAYLGPNVATPQLAALAAELRQMPEVETAAPVDAASALQRFREDVPDMAEITTELGENPLPATVEIRLRSTYRDLPQMETIARRVKALPGVTEVDYGREWAARLGRITRYLWLGTFIMGLFLASAAGLLVANTIRLTIYRRREEIGIYRLVGASNSFIRVPLLIEGAVQGLGGSLVGLALAYGVYRLARYQVATGGSLNDWLLGGISPVWFSPTLLAAAIALGGLIGLVAALLSTGRYMRT
jgi:cell division transport system permease protein